MSYIASVKQFKSNNMTNTKHQIAATILKQLGGRIFIAMTGSKNFVAGDNLLGMKLSRNLSGANYLRITHTPLDVYTMEFLSIRGASIKTKAIHENVYCDMLTHIFTDVTGLDTRF